MKVKKYTSNVLVNICHCCHIVQSEINKNKTVTKF